jgi:hypothetical protein
MIDLALVPLLYKHLMNNILHFYSLADYIPNLLDMELPNHTSNNKLDREHTTTDHHSETRITNRGWSWG